MAKEKKEVVTEEVTLINTGVSVVIIDGKRVLPDEEVLVSEVLLNTTGIEYLFGQDCLEVKNDITLTREIKSRVLSRVKPDPYSKKTLKELEDGGEY